MTYVLAVDPDSKHTGLALVRHNKDNTDTLVDATLAKVKVPKGSTARERVEDMSRAFSVALAKLLYHVPKGETATVVIEWQALNPTGEKNPNAIVDLCGFAGACAAVAAGYGCRILLVTPQEWTGGVDKGIRINRAQRKLGDQAPGLDKMPPGQKSHAFDAAALALWALDPRRRAMGDMKKSKFKYQRK